MNRFTPALLTTVCAALILRAHHRAERERLEARLDRAHAALSAARLRESRAQLKPHLLLNALNSVSVLADEAGAVRVVDATFRLAELIRHALARRAPLTTLTEEVQFLERYLAVERVRLGNLLQVEWQLNEDCLSARVPSLLLQPVVENALHHGITPGSGVAHVMVGARAEGERLRLWVCDRGPGLNAKSRTVGLGLGLTRERLELHFGAGYALNIASRRDQGVRVTMILPLQRDAAVA